MLIHAPCLKVPCARRVRCLLLCATLLCALPFTASPSSATAVVTPPVDLARPTPRGAHPAASSSPAPTSLLRSPRPPAMTTTFTWTVGAPPRQRSGELAYWPYQGAGSPNGSRVCRPAPPLLCGWWGCGWTSAPMRSRSRAHGVGTCRSPSPSRSRGASAAARRGHALSSSSHAARRPTSVSTWAVHAAPSQQDSGPRARW